MKKFRILSRIILVLTITTLSTIIFAQDQIYRYAYISIEGKGFSKKLKVNVDFGDTPEQIKSGEEYSEVLTNKKSYAAVLNYMVENHFELVETLNYSFSYDGTGGTYGIVFIMRKKETINANDD